MKNLPLLTLTSKPAFIRFDTKLDFFDLFKKIEAQYEICFILESLIENAEGRYSLIGFAPDTIIRARGNNLFIGSKKYAISNPYAALRQIMPIQPSTQHYTGGLVGYMSYEAANYFEPALKLKTHPDFDPICFGFYTDGLMLDKFTDEISYFYHNKNRLTKIKKLLAATAKSDKKTVVKKNNQSLSKARHRRQVEKVLREIRAGNAFQCEVGIRTSYSITGPTIPLYETLRQVSPAPYMYYIKFGDKKLIGSSPELLFSINGKEMATFPLAGTVKRGQTASQDKNNARDLLHDPKERAEHAMLVDLHRNDLGRVAKFGTVNLRRFMDIKQFSHVQHLSSEITGIIKNGADMFSGLASCFPAGTLTGAPKIEVMKIIDRNEHSGRGPYGGAAGYFGFNGNCAFAIPIRSLFISGSKGYIQASGGIVYDSTPEREYQEIQNKLAGLNLMLDQFR